ncbi:hypothetical protein [Acetatifactor aquisgranensis]|uniref:hypothetical protein n=1 Tax=Acetatifactor aquisgranensis TaxID=2941233 RepID=UPI00203ED9E5|nr:hypothetical protein [Acetatifactor aquisgranensis]MCI8543188.1 hypothetical protein [Lachnospiraceae bacterium]
MKNRSFFVNLSGILLAFAIAFGGLFAVQSRLAEEKAMLLSGGGEAQVSMQAQAGDSRSATMVDVEVTVADLTEEELCQAVLGLESASEIYPHEPLQGQLSMSGAVECGMAWIGDFFLPHLDGMSAVPREYRMNCYLWAGQEEPGSAEEGSLPGYWSVSFAGQGLEAELTLDAVTGKVLDARVTLSDQEGYPEEGVLSGLLEDYADSFGIETSYVVSAAQEGNGDETIYERESDGSRNFCQRLESEEMAAVLDVDSLVSGPAHAGGGGRTIYFHLYWETKAV